MYLMLFVALFYTVAIWMGDHDHGLKNQKPLLLMLWGFGVIYWLVKYREEKKLNEAYEEQKRKKEINDLKYEVNKLKRKTITKKQTVKKKTIKKRK